MATNDDEATKRDPGGKWLPGQSGNPSGRKPNAERIRQLLQPHQEALVAKAVALALAGDTFALRTCLERLAPPPRPESAAVLVPGLAEAPTLSGKAEAILAAVGNGQLSPDIGERLLTALAAYAKAKELDELQERVTALQNELAALRVRDLI